MGTRMNCGIVSAGTFFLTMVGPGPGLERINGEWKTPL